MKSRLILALLAAAALSAAPASASGADPARTAAAWRELQAAVNTSRVPALLAARQTFADLSEADPSSENLHCGAALAAWRVVPLLMGDAAGRTQARPVVDDGLAHCDAVLARHADHAEAVALKASLQSLLIGLDPAQTMTLGPQSSARLQRAAALAPQNPRVQLLLGIYTLHMPAEFGGGPEEALPMLAAAADLFAAEAPADSTAPAWGRDDALIWAGRANELLGRPKEAGDAYRKALEINPANGWAHALLGALAKPANGGK